MIWSIVRFQKIGWHKFVNAPEGVKYLASLHRHVFFVEVWIEQFHDNRDIEFHLFRDECGELWNNVIDLTSEMSCEMMAECLKANLEITYDRKIKVSVFEDNENGAMIE